MDDSTQDRAAHTPGQLEGPWVLGKPMEPEWINDVSKTPVQFTVTRPDGTPHAVEMTVAEWVRMADSHADLLAALELMLISVDYIKERFGVYAIDSKLDVLARAAIAKAKATPAPMTRAEEYVETTKGG